MNTPITRLEGTRSFFPCLEIASLDSYSVLEAYIKAGHFKSVHVTLNSMQLNFFIPTAYTVEFNITNKLGLDGVED